MHDVAMNFNKSSRGEQDGQYSYVWFQAILGYTWTMSSSSAPRPPYRPLFAPLALLAGLVLASVALFGLSGWPLQAAFHLLLDPSGVQERVNVATVVGIVSDSAEMVAAVLAIAITVVAIVVELAANRYSHEITRLFLREPINMVVLSLYALTTIQCLWVPAGFSISNTGAEMSVGLILTVAMIGLSLLILVPYIYFVFAFLSPVSVIQQISRDAYRQMLRVTPANADRCQARVEEAVDQLQDVARSAIT